jgi:hypothetical protein
VRKPFPAANAAKELLSQSSERPLKLGRNLEKVCDGFVKPPLQARDRVEVSRFNPNKLGLLVI